MANLLREGIPKKTKDDWERYENAAAHFLAETGYPVTSHSLAEVACRLAAVDVLHDAISFPSGRSVADNGDTPDA
jgi:hypothetical protein